LIEIIKDSGIDLELFRRIRLELEDHSLIKKTPFLAEIHTKYPFGRDIELIKVSCQIFDWNGETHLKITSKGKRLHLFETLQHKKNIENLYNELVFRLEQETTPVVDEELSASAILYPYYPLTYKGIDFNGALTTTQIVLSKGEKIVYRIPLYMITNLFLKKDVAFRSINYFKAGIILLLIGSPFLILFIISLLNRFPPAPPLMIFLAVFYSFGFLFLFIGVLKQFASYLLIQTDEGTYKIYSDKTELTHLKRAVKAILAVPFYENERYNGIALNKKIEQSREKFRSFCKSEKYQQKLRKAQDLFEEMKRNLKAGNEIRTFRALRRIISLVTILLDENLGINTINYYNSFQKRRDKKNSLLKSNDFLSSIFLFLLAEGIFFGKKYMTRIIRRAEDHFRTGQYYAACTFFLNAALVSLKDGKLQQFEHLMSRYRLAKSYLQL